MNNNQPKTLRIKKASRQAGFTLIEMLVVISVVGFLSSIIFVTLNNARITARNTSRLNSYKKMAESFEAYRDENGVYPPSYNSYYTCLGPAGSSCFSNTFSGNASVYNSLVPNFIQSLPSTNISTGHGSNYTFIDSWTGSPNEFDWWTFYEGTASLSSCPALIPKAQIATGTWETGYYACIYYLTY